MEAIIVVALLLVIVSFVYGSIAVVTAFDDLFYGFLIWGLVFVSQPIGWTILIVIGIYKIFSNLFRKS